MAAAINIIAHDRLRSLIERIERLTEEKAAIASDIKEVFAQAKGEGFDAKIMRAILKERARDADDVLEERELLDVYRRALGMLADLPLGKAAIAREVKPKRRGKNGHGAEATA